VLVGTSLEENLARLEEHRMVAMTIRSSPDVGPLWGEAQAWEAKLILAQEILEIWVRVQANFLYLEPVMRSEDITATLPTEAGQFEDVIKAWSQLGSKLTIRKPLMEVIEQKEIHPLLQSADEKLENILKSMSAFLESKRQAFARFYFLSNEELLDALGQSTRPERVQQHLKHCFEGIDKLVFVDGEITGMISARGEVVTILEKVCPAHYKGQVEEWLR
jgi:dynein heavy chain, axonemal